MSVIMMLSKSDRAVAKSSSRSLVLLYVCDWNTAHDVLWAVFFTALASADISVGWCA